MRKIILLIGVVLTLFSGYSLFPYVLDLSRLSEYGQGYIVGNLIVLAAGLIMIYFGLKKKK